MVTHDSYAASFCVRVIILKDGEIFDIAENRGNRKKFQETLLKMMQKMNEAGLKTKPDKTIAGGE